MASYGRGGLAQGSRSGQTLSGAYSYGPKSAGEYLSGNLAGEYKHASEVMSTDLVPTAQSKRQSRRTQGAVFDKVRAKESIGKLRDIAGSNAVGEFLQFGARRGRAHQATASQGLLKAESYLPESTVGIEAQTNPMGLGSSGKHQNRLRTALGIGGWVPIEQTRAALKSASEAHYGPDKAISYKEAWQGTDPRSQLHQQFLAQNQNLEQQRYLQSQGMGPMDTYSYNSRYGRRTYQKPVDLSGTAEERYLGM